MLGRYAVRPIGDQRLLMMPPVPTAGPRRDTTVRNSDACTGENEPDLLAMSSRRFPTFGRGAPHNGSGWTARARERQKRVALSSCARLLLKSWVCHARAQLALATVLLVGWAGGLLAVPPVCARADTDAAAKAEPPPWAHTIDNFDAVLEGRKWRVQAWIGQIPSDPDLLAEFAALPMHEERFGEASLFDQLAAKARLRSAYGQGRETARYGTISMARGAGRTYTAIQWMHGPMAILDPELLVPTQCLEMDGFHFVFHPVFSTDVPMDEIIQTLFVEYGPAPDSLRYDLAYMLVPLPVGRAKVTSWRGFKGPIPVDGMPDALLWSRSGEGHTLSVIASHSTFLPVRIDRTQEGRVAWSLSLTWAPIDQGWFPSRALQVLHDHGAPREVRYFETLGLETVESPPRILIPHPTQLRGQLVDGTLETSDPRAWPEWVMDFVEIPGTTLARANVRDRVRLFFPSLLGLGLLLIVLGVWRRGRSLRRST